MTHTALCLAVSRPCAACSHHVSVWLGMQPAPGNGALCELDQELPGQGDGGAESQGPGTLRLVLHLGSYCALRLLQLAVRTAPQ